VYLVEDSWKRTFVAEITFDHPYNGVRVVQRVRIVAPNFGTARSICSMHEVYVRGMNPVIERILRVVD
jgi:hypothetical protein